MKILSTLIITLFCTTLFAQSWLDQQCPSLDEEINMVEFEASKKRNVLDIVINQSDELVINGEEKPNLNSEIRFKEFVLEFVTNPNAEKNKAESPNKVYIKLTSYNKASQKTSKIDTYIKEVYLYLWDSEGQSKYESSYAELACKKREKVTRSFPLRIVSDVSRSVKSNTQAPKKRIGLPPFGGDVKE